jgi:hypothetical protein
MDEKGGGRTTQGVVGCDDLEHVLGFLCHDPADSNKCRAF